MADRRRSGAFVFEAAPGQNLQGGLEDSGDGEEVVKANSKPIGKSYFLDHYYSYFTASAFPDLPDDSEDPLTMEFIQILQTVKTDDDLVNNEFTK